MGMGLAVDSVVRTEFDFADLVFAFTQICRNDFQGQPLDSFDCLRHFQSQFWGPRIRMSGFNQIIDLLETVGTKTRSHQLLGGFWHGSQPEKTAAARFVIVAGSAGTNVLRS